MIIVIADDLTGAAEIAGIATRHGLSTQLTTQPASPLPAADVIVIATDTRSGSATDAVKATIAVAKLVDDCVKTHRSAVPSLNDRKDNADGFNHDILCGCKGKIAVSDRNIILFKKTDSALRGHIVAESQALMRELGYAKALLIPQNPSKGRVIRAGIYLINGVPLDQTPFAYDPEFPARTAEIQHLLNGAKSLAVNGEMTDGVWIADAADAGEIFTQMAKASRNTLIAGAADCFEAFLRKNAIGKASDNDRCARPDSITGSLIVVCGSTQSHSLKDQPGIIASGAAEITMPDDVFNGSPADRWISEIIKSYTANGSIVITINHPSTGGKAYAVRLRQIMAEATSALVAVRCPRHIIIEGGATAFAILDRLGWRTFSVRKELSPGVVSMSFATTNIILKPGSYDWGTLFKGKR